MRGLALTKYTTNGNGLQVKPNVLTFSISVKYGLVLFSPLDADKLLLHALPATENRVIKAGGGGGGLKRLNNHCAYTRTYNLHDI